MRLDAFALKNPVGRMMAMSSPASAEASARASG
jgi:hypothetical protein